MNLEKQFIKFVNEFPDTEMIKRKKLHSLRVASLAEDIGKDDKYFVSGLLHDIGRFPQAKQFETYNDDLSIDHGDLGYQIAKEWGIKDSEILLSIKYHNKLSVPDIPEKNFCSVIRDADIIDILELKIRGEVPLCQGDASLDSISEDVKILIENQKLIPNKLRRQNDINRYLGALAYIFELKNKRSFEILNERNILSKICILHSKNQETEEYLQKLYNDLNSYCNAFLVK